MNANEDQGVYVFDRSKRAFGVITCFKLIDFFRCDGNDSNNDQTITYVCDMKTSCDRLTTIKPAFRSLSQKRFKRLTSER